MVLERTSGSARPRSQAVISLDAKQAIHWTTTTLVTVMTTKSSVEGEGSSPAWDGTGPGSRNSIWRSGRSLASDCRRRRENRQRRVDDALNATRAAVEEGIVAGGGALLRAAANLQVKGANADQQAGIGIIRRALQEPVRQIVQNSGAEGSVVVGKILEDESDTFGYDAQTGEYGDMIALGIIDPVKVVRSALQDAASVAGLLITTEAMIADLPKDSAPSTRGGGGGMDY